MKKFFKILSISVGALIALVLLAAWLIPVFFKEDIKAAIDRQLVKTIDAEVYFELDKFSLSLFSNFPDVTASAGDFGVVGKGEFRGDTLASVKSFEVAIDVMSVLFKDEMQVNGIYLNQPRVQALVNEDGKANWDIMIPSDQQEEADTIEGQPLSVNIEEWKITDGYVRYDDKQGGIFSEVKELNHSGSGTLKDVYSIATNTTAEELTTSYGGIRYLYKNKLDAKIDAIIDLDAFKFTFDQNEISINDFGFHFDGWVAMPEEGIDFNIKYGADKTEFKHLISLIPAVFMEGYEDVKTSGSLAFDGAVQGMLTDDRVPSFELNLKVAEGMFQYPDVPAAVDNINMDLSILNDDGIIDNTLVNLKELHMDIGDNPVDAKLLLKGFENPMIDANMKARIDLEKIMNIFPVEGLTLRGIYNLDAKAQGQYIEAENKLPKVDAGMSLTDGYVKTEDFPESLDNIDFASIVSSKGDMKSTTVDVSKLHFSLGEDEFGAKMYLENFENLLFDITANGVIDLDKIFKLFPLEGMDIKGLVQVHEFNTKGKMSDIENENYQAIKCSGDGSIKSFLYVDDEYLKNGFEIKNANVAFTPEKIALSDFDGRMSKSDLKGEGHISNYMGYVFSPTDTVLSGYMNFHSKEFDVDEWMVEEETTASAEEEEDDEAEEPLEIFILPKNINMVMDAKMDKLKYDDMGITNVSGRMMMKNGILSMEDLFMNMLGADMTMSGEYNTSKPENPTFDFFMDLQNMKIADAYEYFNVVQKYAPGADKFTGDFSTRMKMWGGLENDYMPKYNTLNANGTITLHSATAKAGDMKMFSAISSLTKVGDMGDLTLKNEKMDVVITDGKLYVRPFNAKAGNMNMIIKLVKGITGDIDHEIDMSIPASRLSSAADALGLKGTVSENVDVVLGIGGTSTNPKPKILSTNMKDTKEKVKQEIKDRGKEEIDKRKKEQADKIMKEAKEKAEKIRKESKSLADKTRKEAYDRAQQVEDKASNPLQRKAAEASAKKIRKEGDEKADQIEREGNKRADQVIEKAQQRIDQL